MDSRLLSRTRVQQTMRTLAGAATRARRPRCAACGRPITGGQGYRLHGADFHRRCLTG
ncbi:MAG: hypothetical protein JW895_06475 [Thermoleophilaceae bacterium]|nr:hypothetical protein [Thermoleophilaceae bacterium]